MASYMTITYYNVGFSEDMPDRPAWHYLSQYLADREVYTDTAPERYLEQEFFMDEIFPAPVTEPNYARITVTGLDSDPDQVFYYFRRPAHRATDTLPRRGQYRMDVFSTFHADRWNLSLDSVWTEGHVCGYIAGGRLFGEAAATYVDVRREKIKKRQSVMQLLSAAGVESAGWRLVICCTITVPPINDIPPATDFDTIFRAIPGIFVSDVIPLRNARAFLGSLTGSTRVTLSSSRPEYSLPCEIKGVSNVYCVPSYFPFSTALGLQCRFGTSESTNPLIFYAPESSEIANGWTASVFYPLFSSGSGFRLLTPDTGISAVDIVANGSTIKVDPPVMPLSATFANIYFSTSLDAGGNFAARVSYAGSTIDVTNSTRITFAWADANTFFENKIASSVTGGLALATTVGTALAVPATIPSAIPGIAGSAIGLMREITAVNIPKYVAGDFEASVNNHTLPDGELREDLVWLDEYYASAADVRSVTINGAKGNVVATSIARQETPDRRYNFFRGLVTPKPVSVPMWAQQNVVEMLANGGVRIWYNGEVGVL